MKKILSFVIAFTCATTALFAGCNNEAATPSDTQRGQPESLEPVSFAETDTVLIKNKTSDYVIVIPKEATYVENYAAEELQNFLYESTGCTLPIVTDEGLSNDNTKKRLSVGETSLLEAQTDIVLDYDVMGDAGPSIDTKENTVYLAGATEYGTVYSVYKFLYYQIGKLIGFRLSLRTRSGLDACKQL